MNSPMKDKNFLGKKAVIIGLDGVPHSLLVHYMEQGIMPHLREMTSQGLLLPMDSTLPEVSSVAWSSFMTGKNPAEHGIFGFMELDKKTYEFIFPNFLSIKAPTFWEELGVPAVACNIPQTYPARPMNGVLISGFVALDMVKAVYPKRVYDILHGMGYQLDVKSQLAAKDPEEFFQNLFAVFHKRMEAITYLYDHEDWQIFIGTITETDRLHHFFFDSARGGQYHHIFTKFYRELDEFLWKMFNRAQKDQALFLTCSDHGFAPIVSEVYINRYLQDCGHLNLAGGGSFKDITAQTQAFVLDPARVYIHLKNKYQRGAVETAEYDALREKLKSLFNSLNYNGKRVVKQVFFKEEIFSGPYIEDAPDLYILGEPGFDLKATLNKESVFGASHFHGAHTHGDAHLFISDRDRMNPATKIDINRIPHLVLAYFSA